MKSRRAIRFATFGMSVSALAFISGVVGGSGALAQVSGFYESDNPYVTVDLSVLGNGAAASGPIMGAKSFASGFSGNLLVPGPTPPLSQLHVSPQSGAGSLPVPAKRRIAMTPTEGPSLPPEQPPVSTVNIPGAQLPPPAKPETVPMKAASMPEPAPAPEAPPAPAVVATAPQMPAKAPAKQPEKPAAAVPAKAAQPADDAPPPPPSVEAPEPAPAPPADASEPAKTAAAEGQPEAKQQAALPPAGATGEPGKSLQVVFEASASKLPENARDSLQEMVASIIDQGNLRLQLLAYAGGESLSSSKARRLSLSRALAVRSFLIENGLRSTRIDVRALGNKTAEEPSNRVDINVVER